MKTDRRDGINTFAYQQQWEGSKPSPKKQKGPSETLEPVLVFFTSLDQQGAA